MTSLQPSNAITTSTNHIRPLINTRLPARLPENANNANNTNHPTTPKQPRKSIRVHKLNTRRALSRFHSRLTQRKPTRKLLQGKFNAKATSKVPQTEGVFAGQNNVVGLGFHSNTEEIFRSRDKSQAINMFVVDRLEKMKNKVLTGISRRIKNEKNSNEITLQSTLKSADRSEVALLLKSAMDFGPLDKSTPYVEMTRAAEEATYAIVFPNLGWYFKSLAIEAQKRFEIQKTQRFLTNHNYYRTLRRSSYSFMDKELDGGRVDVLLENATGNKQIQTIYQPGRKRYYTVKQSKINSIEYENHPSIVKLEGFGTNEIVINFSLTPLGRVMFYGDLDLLHEYYMIAKFIQYHNPTDELLLRYLNIQSNAFKEDMKKKQIVKVMSGQTANKILINSNNTRDDNEAVTFTQDGIQELYKKLAQFFAASIMKGNKNDRPQIKPVNVTQIIANNNINFMGNDNDQKLNYFKKMLKPLVEEKNKLEKNPYDTLFKHIHSIGSGYYDRYFKNTTGKRIESVYFREIGDTYINELINAPDDAFKKAFKEAIECYLEFLGAEYKFRKYYKQIEGGGNRQNNEIPQDREVKFLKKEQKLRYLEEVVLLKKMIYDCIHVKEKLGNLQSKDLKNMILRGDESAMFTIPYTDRSTLFRNMNLINDKNVLSTGIYIDDSQFVFDYLSRKHLTLHSRVKQYVRYLSLLSKYSIVRNEQISIFYNSAKIVTTAMQSRRANNEHLRDFSKNIIIKCDFLISNIIDAVNQSNEWFSKLGNFEFTRHLGKAVNENKKLSFMDSSARKSQATFDKNKYNYIYSKFNKLVTKFNEALDDARPANQTNNIKTSFVVYKTTTKTGTFTFPSRSSYRELLEILSKSTFTQDYKKNQKNKNVIMSEFKQARTYTTMMAKQYYPLVHAFQSSGFADKLKATRSDGGYTNKKKIERDFKSVYGTGTYIDGMKMITMYDFLQLISGIDRKKLDEMRLNKENIGYDVFQGGEFHRQFGMVFCPFLPAYSSKASPPEAKPFSVPHLGEHILSNSSFRISWPLQLYGREGDKDLPGSASKSMLRDFDFGSDFDIEKNNIYGRPNQGYVDGYGNSISSGGQGMPPFHDRICISKTVKTATKGSDVPLHGVPYVTADQFTGKRYFTGRSSEHKKVVGARKGRRFDVGGIKVRTWIRETSNLSLDIEPLVNSSIFTFKCNANEVENAMLKNLGKEIYQQNLDDKDITFPTSWSTHLLIESKQSKDLQNLMDPKKFGPKRTKHTMNYTKILEHTKKVQKHITNYCIETAKLLFPSFTWQNMIILFSKNSRVENINNTTPVLATPVLDNLNLQNSEMAAIEKHFNKIVKDFMFASVYVAQSHTEWCAVQFLPYIDRTKNKFQINFAKKLTSLGLNVYGVSEVNNTIEVSLWLPVDLLSSNRNVVKIKRVVDGQLKEFYKENNVMVIEDRDGYIILSCSWFKRINNNNNFKKTTSNRGKISQVDPKLKYNAAKHDPTQWAAMLDLHRLSARCLSKAAALQQMFERENTQAASRRLLKLKEEVYSKLSGLSGEKFQDELSRILGRVKYTKMWELRRRETGNTMEGPPVWEARTRNPNANLRLSHRTSLPTGRYSTGQFGDVFPIYNTGRRSRRSSRRIAPSSRRIAPSEIAPSSRRIASSEIEMRNLKRGRDSHSSNSRYGKFAQVIGSPPSPKRATGNARNLTAGNTGITSGTGSKESIKNSKLNLVTGVTTI